MTHVEFLNRRFGEELGRPNGIDPRFAWKYAPEVYYYFRPHYAASFERRSWADRIGKRWMLCQWRPTELSREQWQQAFRGAYPYPEKGEYKAHPETALWPGMLPTSELTAGYIRTLKDQMLQAELALKAREAGRQDELTIRLEKEAIAQIEAKRKEFYEMTADWEPLSWKLDEPHMPGDHDGPVCFGGL
jgi:hypothetical protein